MRVLQRFLFLAVLLVASVASAGSTETIPTPTPAPGETPLPDPTGTPMIEATPTATPVITPAPTPTPKPKSTSDDLPAVKLFKKVEDKFPYFRGSFGAGFVDFQRDSYAETNGNKGDTEHSSANGLIGSGEAVIGAFVLPHLLVTASAVRMEVQSPTLEREGGSDVELDSMGIGGVGIGAEWHAAPRDSGFFAGGTIGIGYVSADLPENPAEVETLGANGPVLSLGAGYMHQLPYKKFRGGVHARVLVGMPMHGEAKGADENVTYGEDDRIITVSVMATLSYF